MNPTQHTEIEHHYDKEFCMALLCVQMSVLEDVLIEVLENVQPTKAEKESNSQDVMQTHTITEQDIMQALSYNGEVRQLFEDMAPNK